MPADSPSADSALIRPRGNWRPTPRADASRYRPLRRAGRVAHRRGHGAPAYTLHAQNDDWGQAGAMVRELLDAAARTRLVNNIVGHLLNKVSESSVDKDPGGRVEQGIRAGHS